MSSVIFQAFDPALNPVDQLFDFLERAHPFWQFERLGTNSRLHIYKWPDIILSEKLEQIPDLVSEEKKWKYPVDDGTENVSPDDCIDLLGKYVSRGNKVYLFVKRIEATAIKFHHSTARHTCSLEDSITQLTNIVLVHEMMHAIMRLTLKHPLKYSTQEEICFHEGVAQYFAYLIAGSRTGLPADLFTWLTNRQTNRYKVFQKLLPFRVEDVLAGVAVCTMLNYENWTELVNDVKDASGIIGSIEDKIQHCL